MHHKWRWITSDPPAVGLQNAMFHQGRGRLKLSHIKPHIYSAQKMLD